MAPPQPPTQAGKFKPSRKPAKKIRPDVAHSSSGTSVAVPIAVPSNASSASAGRFGGRSGFGRGAARGGGGREGGGRGRGRFIIPQGQAFFTAAPPPARSAARIARSSAPGNRSIDPASRSSHQQPQEEIVGTLDACIPDGVGSMSSASAKKTTQLFVKDSEMSLLDRALMGEDVGRDSQSAAGSATQGRYYTQGYYSDSDSSQEEDQGTTKYAREWNERHRDDAQELEPLVPSFAQRKQTHSHSPFLMASKNSDTYDNNPRPVYLFQFPTRLPPVDHPMAPNKKDESLAATADDYANINSNSDVQIIQDAANTTTTAKACTAPCDTTAFDGTFHRHTTVAGKVGKLQIFKSGQMRLVLEQQQPSSSLGRPNNVVMVVNQGLSHSFRQEAVALDLEHAQYKTVGTIEKTLVVTPDLSNAFSSS